MYEFQNFLTFETWKISKSQKFSNFWDSFKKCEVFFLSNFPLFKPEFCFSRKLLKLTSKLLSILSQIYSFSFLSINATIRHRSCRSKGASANYWLRVAEYKCKCFCKIPKAKLIPRCTDSTLMSMSFYLSCLFFFCCFFFPTLGWNLAVKDA